MKSNFLEYNTSSLTRSHPDESRQLNDGSLSVQMHAGMLARVCVIIITMRVVYHMNVSCLYEAACLPGEGDVGGGGSLFEVLVVLLFVSIGSLFGIMCKKRSAKTKMCLNTCTVKFLILPHGVLKD